MLLEIHEIFCCSGICFVEHEEEIIQCKLMLSERWLDMMVSAAIDLELLAASVAKTVVTV